MNDAISPLLATVLLLGKEDGALARIFAERKKLENDLVAKRAAVSKGEAEALALSRKIAESKFHWNRDDKALKEERDKLVLRRKTLASLGNYKTQQAASREIEHSSRELDEKEEVLITVMNQIEAEEKIEIELKAKLELLKAELGELEKESVLTIENLDNRHKIHSEERQKLAVKVDNASITLYNRIKDKFPMDPAVPVKNGTCAGCFMQVVPQLVVQIGRGDSLIKCRGCGRILYMEGTAAAAA